MVKNRLEQWYRRNWVHRIGGGAGGGPLVMGYTLKMLVSNLCYAQNDNYCYFWY